MKTKIAEVITEVYYLKMNTKPNFTEINHNKGTTAFKILPKPITNKEYLFYYKTVGEAYNWLDRILMDETKLNDVINAPKTEVFVYKINNQDAGFAEFIREENYTEILYFGLFDTFIGKGYGKQFLQEVIEEAWANDPEWIQLNTCKLDHPNALSTYQKNGFVLDKTTFEKRSIQQK